MRLIPSIRLAILASIGSAALLLPSAAVHAQPVNFLVKGSSSTVYFNSADGKRYFFPNESVFNSWYTDYSSVAQVSDAQLAALPLAGNVLYRPGSVLIKITTDPKTYAVSRYGVLHWVTSEAVATSLYGADWNTKVRDVPDTFFSNYIVGYPINAATDFSVNAELTSAVMPEDNVRMPTFIPPTTPVTPTSTAAEPDMPMAEVRLSTSQAVLNQPVSIDVKVTQNNLQISKIEIHSNATSQPLQTCLNSTTCSYMFTVQTAPLFISYYAIVVDSAGTRFTTVTSQDTALSVLSASNQIQLSATPQATTAGSRVNFSSTVTNTPTINSHKIYIVIPGQTQAVLWKDCGVANPCAASTPFFRTTYIYSQVTTGNQTLVSPEVLISVTGGDAPKPTLTVAGHPNAGQVQIDVTAPYGETIGLTSIVDGTSINDKAIALCDKATCSVTVNVVTPGSLTAFTWVGGKYEQSNTVMVSPQ